MPADAATAQFNNVARIDFMCFGPSLKPSYKRRKKRLNQIDEWVKTTRHKVMYKDESKID